ncbi:MAG TPA: exonuclease domain-containing protein [Geopsychrobacteraceae bacterium]|nr:exonuclease domain-containing protein [Geopsychrobacteraceae bacterium]
MKPSTKYLLFIVTISLAVFMVVMGSLFASWMGLTPAEQGVVDEMIPKLLPYPMVGALILCVIVGGLVSLLFHYYITPILRLGEETKLISIANPNYRIVTNGAKEIIDLTNIINESAEAFSTLQADVQSQINASQTELNEERTRFAALMSELPNGVLVCNIDGQILLYNIQAQRLFTRKADGAAKPQGLIGLGRSIFSILDRNPIVHALELLNTALEKGQPSPITNFMMTLRDGQYLRVNMAPVFIERKDTRKISGFVLTLEDMTRQIESDTRRDILIQSLTDDLQDYLSDIRNSISTILKEPELPRDQLNDHRVTIDKASSSIAEIVEQARINYATHLHSLSRMEYVLADNLLEVLANNIRERFAMKVKTVADDGQWLMIDSYTIVQAISHLAAILSTRAEITEFEITLEQDNDKVAFMTILWPDRMISQSLLEEWKNSPISTDSKATVLTLNNIISKRQGKIKAYPEGSETASAIQITIPPTHQDAPLPIQTSLEHRPISYEFDLFNRQGWEELSKQPLSKLTFVVFDTETTGLNPSHGDEIIQLGAIRIVNSQLLYDETIDQLVDPQRHVPSESVAIHGIDPQLLVGQPTIDKVLPHFHQFVENSVLVAHNAAFDMRFLELKEKESGIHFDNPVLDTLLLSSVIHPNQSTHALEGLAERLDVHIVGRHTALGDAIVTGEVLVKMIPLLEAHGIHTLEDAFNAQATSPYAKQKY